jgi:hypothetical protein
MTRPIRWIVIVGLVVLTFFLSYYSGDAVGEPGDHGDWRASVGEIVVLLSIAFYLTISRLGAAKRRQSADHRDPASEAVFSGPAGIVPTMLLVVGAVIGAYLLFSAEVPSMVTLALGCGGIVLAVLMSLVAIIHIASGPFRLSLSASGLDYAPFKCGPIAWQDIRKVDVKRFLSSELISIEIADADKYFARGFPKSGRNMGRFGKTLSSPFVIYPKQLRASTEAILGAINARLRAFGPASD